MGSRFFEVVGDDLYPMNADIYHKESGKYCLGYKNEKGKFAVYEKDRLLELSGDQNLNDGRHLYNVDLYEDISGKYLPFLDQEETRYLERKDGQVERIVFNEKGSRGKIVEDQRKRLSN